MLLLRTTLVLHITSTAEYHCVSALFFQWFLRYPWGSGDWTGCHLCLGQYNGDHVLTQTNSVFLKPQALFFPLPMEIQPSIPRETRICALKSYLKRNVNFYFKTMHCCYCSQSGKLGLWQMGRALSFVLLYCLYPGSILTMLLLSGCCFVLFSLVQGGHKSLAKKKKKQLCKFVILERNKARSSWDIFLFSCK